MIPFHTVFMDIVLRHVVSNASQPINSRIDEGITIKSLFSGPWSGIAETFSQVKVKRVHLYASAGVGYEERGYHLLNLSPRMEFEVTGTTKFDVLMTLPGTKMNRMTRMVSSVWFPTDPSERMWLKTDSGASLMDYSYMSKGQTSGGTAAANYPLEIVIDAHVRVRGVNYAKLKSTLDGDELDAEFINLATN